MSSFSSCWRVFGLVVLLFAFGTRVQAQNCALSFTTQAELDAFAVSGTSCVVGTLSIMGGTGPGGIYDLSALKSLTDVVYDVNISLGNLTNLEGLDNLKRVGGTLSIGGATSLTDLSDGDFVSLESVGESLLIRNNSSLANISGFFRLRSVKHIEITANPNMVAIMGFGALTSVQGMLDITQCNKLGSISGFNSLQTMGGLTGTTSGVRIISNPLLGTIPGFNNLVATDIVNIDSNGLTELSGFNKLRSVQTLSISNNTTLRSISGFNGGLVAAVEPGVVIAVNPRLETLTGFAGLDTKSLLINLNARLQEISGFNDSKVDRSHMISNNAALEKITGFRNSGSPLYLIIKQHPQLDSITGFTGARAPQWIGVEENATLVSLSKGFAYTDYSPLTTLKILNNAALVACEASWVCQYLRRGGFAEISGNGSGCTRTSILQTCQPLSNQQPVASVGPAYPNPVRDILHLSSPAPFRLYDLTGRLLLQGEGAQVSVAALPSGVYVLETGRQAKRGVKIVKL